MENVKAANALRGDDILNRLLDFSTRIGKVVDALRETRLARHIAGLLVRCGTSGPLNYNEGRNAESRDDFIHKLSIVLKELSGSQVCLQLITRAELLPAVRLAGLWGYATCGASKS